MAKTNSKNKSKNISKNKNQKKNRQNSSQKSMKNGFRKHNRAPKQKHTWRSEREKKQLKGKSPQTTVGELSLQSKLLQQKIKLLEKRPPKRHQESSSLRTRMLERLSIAKFRTINSTESPSTTLSNPKAFQNYHTALESTSKSWTTNPLDVIISWINSTIPKSHIIADLGCGSAKLQSQIQQKTFSFDLHALNSSVTACDIRDLPLEDESVHLAVFCLSLMGTDVTEYLTEAWRIVKRSGLLKIGEVAGRVGDLEKFKFRMKSHGFKFLSMEHVGGSDVFVVLEFKKIGKIKDEKLLERKRIMLEPVVYKKR